MASEWRPLVLGKVCAKIGSGATPRGGKEAYRGGATALIRSQNIYNDRFVHDGLAYIDDAQADELGNVVVERDDVLLNITGDSVARCCKVAPDVLPARVNQHVAIIRPKADVLDARFLRYSLVSSSMQAQLMALASAGATRNALTKGMIEALVVEAPPLEEQLAIAETLGALDDRIANLRQTNATLQAIAAALFKSRFADFDGVPPEDMQESELGLIPKGWRVASLEEHVDAERGLSYKGAGLAEAGAGVPMHNLNSVLEFGGYKYAGIKYYSGDYKEKHLAVAGDIIVANTEQGHEHKLIGFPAIVPGSYTSGLFSHHLYRVRIKIDTPITREWLYHCLMTPAVREQIIGCANGSTVNMLKPDGLKIPRFALPPHELCETFDDVAASLRLKAEANVEQMETLTALRDTLLPRLISGQLRIKDAEAFLKERGA